MQVVCSRYSDTGQCVAGSVAAVHNCGMLLLQRVVQGLVTMLQIRLRWCRFGCDGEGFCGDVADTDAWCRFSSDAADTVDGFKVQ